MICFLEKGIVYGRVGLVNKANKQENSRKYSYSQVANKALYLIAAKRLLFIILAKMHV